MSFYGSQFLDINKIFYKFLFKQQGIDIQNLDPQAIEQIIFNTDSWLTFNPYGNNGITIGHGEPQEINSIIEVNATDSNEESILLNQGAVLFNNKLGFDKKGHYVNIEQGTSYTLPTVKLLANEVGSIPEGKLTISSPLNDAIQIIGSDECNIQIQHQPRDLENSGTAITITPNVIADTLMPENVLTITTPVTKYDSGGHCINITNQPINIDLTAIKTQQGNDLTNRLTTSETNYTTISNEVNGLKASITTLNNSIQDIEDALKSQDGSGAINLFWTII